jgi:hypothetical protein
MVNYAINLALKCFKMHQAYMKGAPCSVTTAPTNYYPCLSSAIEVLFLIAVIAALKTSIHHKALLSGTHENIKI